MIKTTPDWSQLFVDAGAKLCPKCGTNSLIPVNTPEPGPVDSQNRLAHGREPGSLWFCFECGHEEQA